MLCDGCLSITSFEVLTMDELYLGFVAGALTFGWLLPWIGKKLNRRDGGKENA